MQNSFEVLHPGFDRVMIIHTRANKDNLFYWLKIFLLLIVSFVCELEVKRKVAQYCLFLKFI